MTLFTRIAIGGVATALIALLALGRADYRPAAQPPQKTELLLLTSLPILFGEQFSLEAPATALKDRLDRDFALRPIGTADAESLKEASLLFMAHARAQPATALAELDQWVREGGRLLILTDPRLSWHSERALGDRLRPPVNFADTALLAHWGLTLAGPEPDGPATRTIDGTAVMAATPGIYTSTGSCNVEPGGFVARCRIGKGWVTAIADADWLNVGNGKNSLDGPTDQNLDILARELARLRD